MALPIPAFDTAPEPFATYWGESECEMQERPGVLAFRDFVLRHQGGGKGHTGRPCGATGPKSGHYSGRAWDWMIDATDPDQRARADELIAWLLANDAEIFRRAGLMYLIWDKQRFGTKPAWQPYGGWKPDGTCGKPPCKHPHQDHVHFSFTKAGAAGQTSFYRWLEDQQEMPPLNIPPTPHPYFPLARASAWPSLLGFAAGIGGVYWLRGRARWRRR